MHPLKQPDEHASSDESPPCMSGTGEPNEEAKDSAMSKNSSVSNASGLHERKRDKKKEEKEEVKQDKLHRDRLRNREEVDALFF